MQVSIYNLGCWILLKLYVVTADDAWNNYSDPWVKQIELNLSIKSEFLNLHTINI